MLLEMIMELFFCPDRIPPVSNMERMIEMGALKYFRQQKNARKICYFASWLVMRILCLTQKTQ